MKLKFLYTLAFIFCMSGFASSNECSRTCRDGHPRMSATPGIEVEKPLVSQREQPSPAETEEYTPFQIIKFLYI